MESTGPTLGETYASYATDPAKQRAWAAGNAGNQAIRAELTRAALRMASPVRGPILDVGCGTGWWLAELLARGVPAPDLCGLDALPARVDAARRRAPGTTVVAGDAAALPWADGSFGLVTLLLVLSSLPPAKQSMVLDEALRVVRADGLVLVWEPRWPNPRNPATQSVRAALAERRVVAERTLTVVPPLARLAASAYRPLTCIPALRTHRLVALRTPAGWIRGANLS